MINYKRLIKSVFIFKLYTIVYEFDVEIMLKLTIEYILKQFMPIIFCRDLKLWYNFAIKWDIT